MPGQRRGTRIVMTDDERDAFLRAQPVCRVATVGAGGHPHTSALWFVWDGTALWLNSLTKSRRWADIRHRAEISVLIDDGGFDFLRLRGVELLGCAEVVGEVPRKGGFSEELAVPERMFAEKYMGTGAAFQYDGRHAWLRLRPQTIASWDFAKLRT